jgi:hypothetical protein
LSADARRLFVADGAREQQARLRLIRAARPPPSASAARNDSVLDELEAQRADEERDRFVVFAHHE